MLSKSALKVYSVKHHLYNQFFVNTKDKNIPFVKHISPNLKYIYVYNIKDYINMKTFNDTIEQRKIKDYLKANPPKGQKEVLPELSKEDLSTTTHQEDEK